MITAISCHKDRQDGLHLASYWSDYWRWFWRPAGAAILCAAALTAAIDAQAQSPAVAPTAAAGTLSPDGSIINPPQSLTTVDGNWTFGQPLDSNNWGINLNGLPAAFGLGSKIVVDNGGQLYLLGTDNNWRVWRKGSWSLTSAPSARVQEQAQSPSGRGPEEPAKALGLQQEGPSTPR